MILVRKVKKETLVLRVRKEILVPKEIQARLDRRVSKDRKAQRRTFGQIHIYRKPLELKHFHLLRNHRFLKIFRNILQPSFFWIDNL